MKSISSNKYNLIHLISVVFIAVLLAVVYFLSTSQKLYFNIGTYDLLIGMLVSMFAFINSKHLFNLMIFKEIKKNPSILSGKIMQSYEYSIKTSIAQALTTSFVLFFVFVFSPSYFTFGFFLGPLVIALKMKKWGKKRDNNKEIKIPELTELLDMYENSWVEDWYSSKRQREEYHKKGKRYFMLYNWEG